MRKSTFTILLIGVLAWHARAAIAEPLSDRITVTVRGAGPDVVLIPGLASSSAVWDATARRLEGRYRLHIVRVTILYPWDTLTGMPQAAFDGLYRESFAPLPNKTIVRVDGSFHFIMLDQPEAFAAQVDAFLK